MSRVDWGPYAPGDARDVTPWNTAMQTLVVESATLGAENFAQEGLNVSRFAHRPRSQEFEFTDSTRDATGLTSTTWADFNPNGTAFNYGTDIALGGSEMLLIRYYVFLSTRGGSEGRDQAVDFRVGIKPVGAGAETFHAQRPIGGVGGHEHHGWVAGSYLLKIPDDYDYIRLQYQLRAAGTIRPHYCSFWGLRLRGVA